MEKTRRKCERERKTIVGCALCRGARLFCLCLQWMCWVAKTSNRPFKLGRNTNSQLNTGVLQKIIPECRSDKRIQTRAGKLHRDCILDHGSDLISATSALRRKLEASCHFAMHTYIGMSPHSCMRSIGLRCHRKPKGLMERFDLRAICKFKIVYPSFF